MSKDTKPARDAQGYSDADLADVMNFPELTDEQLATAKPFAEVLPELAGTIRRRGRQKAPTKVPVSLRLDPAVLEHFKKGGRGWQARMGDALRKAANL